jgi:S-adenosylmethionine:tRNA ribosyltransferase-isomerase
MLLDRQTGFVRHRQFTDLLDELVPGDLLVMNDTKVLPARLHGRKSDTGAHIELLLLKSLGNDHWLTLVKPGKRVKPGTVIVFGEPHAQPQLTATVIEVTESGERIVAFHFEGIFYEVLERLGTMPLPPYIKESLSDPSRYQTVYAQNLGSAAAPTAGLHFTEQFLEMIQKKGVRLATLTLHVGLGTFRPVSSETVEGHTMHEEYYEIPSDTALAIHQTRAEGKRIVAIGTTSARTLETAAAQLNNGHSKAITGWTNIFIYPGYQFQCVDALLTNFHLPKSTLIMMVSALAGTDAVMAAYREAIKEEYRFFSFGDAMFIS